MSNRLEQRRLVAVFADDLRRHHPNWTWFRILVTAQRMARDAVHGYKNPPWPPQDNLSRRRRADR